MDTSIIPWCGAHSAPHIVVMGNHKGGSGTSTFAMHIIVALLKAGKRVASFDLDSNQLTLSRYISNRGDWAREQKLRLELPDHTPIAEEPLYGRGPSDAATFKQFISHLKRISRKSSHDFIIIDTPGG